LEIPLKNAATIYETKNIAQSKSLENLLDPAVADKKVMGGM